MCNYVPFFSSASPMKEQLLDYLDEVHTIHSSKNVKLTSFFIAYGDRRCIAVSAAQF